MIGGEETVSRGLTRHNRNPSIKTDCAAELEALQRRINAIKTENYDTQQFVPEDDLEKIMTKETMDVLLHHLEASYEKKNLAMYAVDRAPKIFAVLVMIGHPDKIRDFQTNDQYRRSLDDQGPFSIDDLKRILADELVANLFFNQQWEFWVPRFSGDVVHRKFLPRTIFPFMSWDFLAKGGYGVVDLIEIHEQYRPFSPHQVDQFVKKEFPPNEATFEIEAHILTVLQQLKHPNILPLISCYTHKQKHNLISPYISGGNLRALLAEAKPAQLPREELFCSMAGIASALWALHECVLDEAGPVLKGLHQDLNPDNILVDGISGHSRQFILADFGLASIKQMSADSRTPYKGRLGYWQAPESADIAYPWAEHSVTRAIDIWALGCMMAELAVHFVGGPSGVEAFRKTREFTSEPVHFRGLYHKGQMINAAVERCLADISKEDGSKPMENLTSLILAMLEADPAQRPRASQVTAELYRITIQAFCSGIHTLFTKLPTSWEVLIEKSRMLAWFGCQTTDFFLSMPGATKAHQTFQSTVRLLRQFFEQLKHLYSEGDDPGSRIHLDSRALWQVRSLNTQLSSMLPPDKKADAQSQFETILFADAESAKLHIISDEVRRVLGDSRITQMAQQIWLVDQMKNDKAPTGQLEFKQLSSKDFKKSKRNQIDVAELRKENTTMFLESVPYQDQVTGKSLLPRFLSLCTLLSNRSQVKELRTPHLYALCNNTADLCYDLLYEFPQVETSQTSKITPITLYKLLSEKDPLKRPSLDHRLSLALKLAETVAAFHQLNWFHKDLTSSNILFFPQVTIPASSPCKDPYLCGFGNSRQADDGFTQGPPQKGKHHRYHYPGYVSIIDRKVKKFIRQYDWYSLGVVLLEIGFWQPIDSLMASHATEGHENFAKKLREEKLPSLSFYLGSEFVDVVRFCLESPDNVVAEPGSARSSNRAFKSNVLGPLQGLSGRFAESFHSRKRKAVADVDTPELRPARRRHG